MPELGLGCVGLGSLGRRGVRLIHAAADSGVSAFDTADVYGAGSSERLLGSALRGRRDRVFLATKVGYRFEERGRASIAARRVARPAVAALRNRRPGAAATVTARAYQNQDFSPEYLRRAVEGSLRRLRTDYLDLLQLHGPPPSPSERLADLVARLLEEGKIRHFGVGVENGGLDQARRWIESGLIDRIQVPFGILDPEAGANVIPAASREGVAVWIRGAFASGLLARPTAGGGADGKAARVEEVRRLARQEGVSCLQVAAWFAAASAGVSTVLIGTASLDHLRDDVAMFRSDPPPGVVAKFQELTSSWMQLA